MRIFVGLPPKTEFISRLISLQREWQLPGRLIPPENLHLTLLFLGELSQTQTNALAIALASLKIHSPFNLEFKRVVSKPSQAGGRIYWLESDVTSELRALVEDLRALIEKLDISFKVFHHFRSHISLSRATKTDPKVKSFDLPKPLSLQVARFALYSSTLSSAGARYEVLQSYELART